MIECISAGASCSIRYNDISLLEGLPSKSWISIGKGNPDIDMYRGNFFIREHMETMLDLDRISIVSMPDASGGQGWELACTSSAVSSGPELRLRLAEKAGRLELSFSAFPEGYNRLVLRIKAEGDEHVYGCGEQFSFLDLRGRNFPIWVQEQGVGRNKATEITRTADRLDRAGGDYHTTFYPQPTYVSTRGYFLHAETYGYADFDFSDPACHVLTFWDLPQIITVGGKESLMETVQDVSAFLGRQRELPDWIYDGIILGIQGGSATCRKKLEAAEAAGVPVCGIWAQDWEGEKYTSFGKRLRWNWQWDEELYPGLDRYIPELRSRGIRFLGYINSNILEGAPLYEEAKRLGHLVRNCEGGIFLVDFGEFNAGMVDFTSPGAFEWYKGIIRKYLIEFGLSGWMADFGEYLPVESVVADGTPGMIAHNAWPGLWAKVNHDAVADAGAADEILFFMRAGNARSPAWCQMMWAGDQNVDWSEDDGLPSALTGALSLAMSGHGLHHSDIGGYTTLYGMKRSKELFLRWAEFAALSPLMRTHEGNRPGDNWQFDGDRDTLERLARLTGFHAALKPYLKDAVAMNARKGIPVMSPLFLYYPSTPFFTCKDQYMLGPDLLVCPVMEEGAVTRKVRLPRGSWIHLPSGQSYGEGTHTVDAPLGCPPVFCRGDSTWLPAFREMGKQLSAGPVSK